MNSIGQSWDRYLTNKIILTIFQSLLTPVIIDHKQKKWKNNSVDKQEMRTETTRKEVAKKKQPYRILKQKYFDSDLEASRSSRQSLSKSGKKNKILITKNLCTLTYEESQRREKRHQRTNM